MKYENQTEQMKNFGHNFEALLLRIAEYGMYVYLFLLLFDKGEGLRNMSMYGSFLAWLFLVFYFKKPRISPDIISIGFLVFIISILMSSVTSIEWSYSWYDLQREVPKSVIPFLVISTFFNQRMISRASRAFSVAGLIILAFGLHGMIIVKTNLYTSENIFLSLDKNEFGFFAVMCLPFIILQVLASTSIRWKVFWTASSMWGIVGTFLSASRGSIGGMIISIGVFVAYLAQIKHWKTILGIVLVLLIVLSVAFKFLPGPAKTHLMLTKEHLRTLTFRTDWFWKPALQAVKKRPVLGWGYGDRTYRDVRPFEGTEKPNWEIKGGLHSAFITVLFQQGLVGFISYIFLLLSTTFILMKLTKSKQRDRKLIAVALLSIIVGAFIVNSFVIVTPFRRLAPILAMSSALLKYMDNES